MALIFPSNPTVGQNYSSGSTAVYQWDGAKWVVVQPASTTVVSAISARTSSFVNTLNQPVIVSGAFSVFTGSGTEFSVSNTGLTMGNLASDRHTVTGSIHVSNGVTASLFGTASLATSASFVSSPYIYLFGNPNQGINNSSTLYSTNTRIPVNGLTAPYTRPSAGSFTVSSTGITPNVTGWYEIHCNIFGLDAGGGDTTFSLGIGINGTAISSTLLQTVISSLYSSISVCGVGFVTAGQLIDFRAGSTGGQLITVQGMNVIAKYISA